MSADPSPDERPARWTPFAVLFVAGSLAAFVLVLFLANFTGEISSRGELRRGTRAARVAAKAERRDVADADPFLVFGEDLPRPPAPAGASNLVVVVATGLRRDHVTPYGAGPDMTPRLQALAERGARFGDAISASPFSRTAAVAWLTGQHALAVGMVEPGPRQNELRLPDTIETFPERLRAAGWVTLGVTANPNLNTSSGLAQGFDRYRETEPDGLSPRHRLSGEDAVRLSVSLLDARPPADRERPFYLQVSLLETHQPYRPAPDAPSPYIDAVRRTDILVGSLMDALAARSYDPGTNTYVVVMADHGTGLEQPEHHGKWHGRLLYPTSVLFPFLVAGPDVPAHRVVGGLVSHTDVPPTLLELLGLPAPAGIDGTSWAGAVRGTADRTTRTRAFSDTWYFTANRASIWTDGRQCQKDFGSTRLEDDSFEDGCYDRVADPEFRHVFQDEVLSGELARWREAWTP